MKTHLKLKTPIQKPFLDRKRNEEKKKAVKSCQY